MLTLLQRRHHVPFPPDTLTAIALSELYGYSHIAVSSSSTPRPRLVNPCRHGSCPFFFSPPPAPPTLPLFCCCGYRRRWHLVLLLQAHQHPRIPRRSRTAACCR